MEKALLAAANDPDGMHEPECRAWLERMAAFRTHVAAIFDDEKSDALVYPLQKHPVILISELNQATATVS